MKTEEQRVDLREQLMIGMPGRQFRSKVERQLSLSQVRPDAPRGVRIEGNVLKWDAPQDPRGITHYTIYADDDRVPKRRVPVGQLECSDPITGQRFYVEAFNLFTMTRSSKGMVDAGASVTLGPVATGTGATSRYELTLSATTVEIADPFPSSTDGQMLAVVITQAPTGGKMVTWSSAFASDTSTDIAPGNNAKTKFLFVRNSGVWEQFADPMREAG